MRRRTFLKAAAGAGAGLVLAVSIRGCGDGDLAAPPEGSFAPDAWIRIGPDGLVTVVVDRSEMGQGVSTALPMLVAEELDADWAAVRYQFAPANTAYYNQAMGLQATGGSTSVRAAWEPLRRAGAAARAMLMTAAAAEWSVPVAECSTEPGAVVHTASGRRAGYGSLAAAAATVAVPDNPPLKQPSDYRIIGRPVERLDLRDKVTGAAEFGLDAGPRDALVAVVARCPVFGGKLAGVDAAPALAVPGVRRVVELESGVAVVADTFWAARRGREALKPSWTESRAAVWDDATIDAHLAGLLEGDVRVGHRTGTPEAEMGRTVAATYRVPFLAHATMEPVNATADVSDDGVTVWVPTQFQTGPALLAGGGARHVAARAAGVSASRVDIHTTHLGGGFGRRFELEVVREVVTIARAVGRPVRLVWTREDDVRHDSYRPAALHAFTASLGDDGLPRSWRHRVATQSITAKFLPGFVPRWAAHLAGPLKGGIDASAVEGALHIPYAIPNFEMGFAEADLPIPVGYWRSVAHSHTAFAVECFIDELADAAGVDPLAYRLSLLAGSARHRGVLELAAREAGWSGPAAPGRFRGLAVHESFGSYVAQVAEVSVAEGRVRVHRVTCAIDCGRVVNPDTVRAQMEGGIAFGLSAALTGRISIEAGRVKESNFHDYPVLRMSEMPAVDVHIVESGFEPGGVGEPGTPPIAPAVANAVSRAIGRRVRELPLGLGR